MHLEGKKLGGRYEIIGRLGGGGMAVVYKALDHSLNRYVALKVLSESLSNDNEFIRRFSREAQAVASLSHPNVVNVYDVGQDGYTYYIVMELVEGPTLKQYIQQKGILPVDEAALIAIRICDGLAHAHENQIIHRDIKPHNILLDQKHGRVKVTDFGIARAASSSTITQKGAVMGSVHYFSPEQARGGLTGEKSDIYSLGIVMYEMLTGQLPFDGDQAISIALMHLQNPVPDPREINPNIPDNFVKILLRALEKDPEMRYTSVRAMMKDISAALRMISRDKSNSPDDLFMTIPVDGDDTTLHGEPVPTKKAAVTYESASRRQSAQPSWDNGNRPEPFPKPVDGNVKKQNDLPVDNKELTIFQKTAIWFENAQEKLTWKQKAGFGLITIIVILALSVFGLNFVVGLFSGGNSGDESSNQQTQTHTQAPKVDTSKSEKKEMVPVKNYVGQWQGRLEGEQVDSLKKNGYKIEVSDSLCTNKNTTGTLKHGQIARQEPTDQVEKGGTVKVYVYSENGKCKY